MSNLLDLEKILSKKVSKLENAVSKIAVDTATVVVNNLITVTPVDTSTALSNWQVTLNSPVDSPRHAYSLGRFGSTQAASAYSAISAAQSTLSKRKYGETIYISNVVDYISELNDGSSSQEPEGFVERAVLLGRKKVKTSKIKV